MKKFVITGSNGLIGKALSKRLEAMGKKVVKVDNGADVEISDLFRWLAENEDTVEWAIHLGANTNTMEMDEEVFRKYNYGYSESLWYRCAKYGIPLIYASSAATYGLGELGYSDNLHPQYLKPLNPYGHSKNEFDRFVLSHHHINDQTFWAGLKFFNVYGYDESHKGKMASMVYHAYNQIKETGKVRLFRDGHHSRDFIWVENVVDVIVWMIQNSPASGIYNVGTGQQRSFKELANAVFAAMNQPTEIEYFEMPEQLKGKYQAYTQADISKLRNAGYLGKMESLEAGVEKYVKTFLMKH